MRSDTLKTPDTAPATDRVSSTHAVASPYSYQLAVWYEQHRREWVAGMEQHGVEIARIKAASADASAKQVDGGLVDELIAAYPKMTREEAIKLIELAGA